jgi:hypothetical protein
VFVYSLVCIQGEGGKVNSVCVQYCLYTGRRGKVNSVCVQSCLYTGRRGKSKQCLCTVLFVYREKERRLAVEQKHSQEVRIIYVVM